MAPLTISNKRKTSTKRAYQQVLAKQDYNHIGRFTSALSSLSVLRVSEERSYKSIRHMKMVVLREQIKGEWSRCFTCTRGNPSQGADDSFGSQA